MRSEPSKSHPLLPSEFDAQFYLSTCSKDLQSLDPDAAYQHFRSRRGDQNVFPSASAFLKDKLSDSKFPGDAKRICVSFNWRDYRDLNEDLRSLSPLEVVKHYLANGIYEPRQILSSARLLDRRFAVQAKLDRVAPDVSIQVVVHCYYYDILCGLHLYLRTLARLGAKILVLVVNDRIQDSVMDDFLGSLCTGGSNHEWFRMTNYGEDWSSFHLAFQQGLLIKSGVIYKIQTKKSANLGPDGGVAWTDEALQPICGSYSNVFDTTELLTHGMRSIVASSLCRQTGFGANKNMLYDYLEQLDLSVDAARNDSFCMGSMFAADAGFLHRYFSRLGQVDYKQESAGGTKFCGRYVGHAIERTIYYFASQVDGSQAVAWVD
ncbi:rhamnan synthesis F family protein [Cyanobium sp. NS01]|uniref:rhamnan synthesis F family protein n=1 Tax=Cyanobium sp. NS01 TaxID=261284 RepID=UPI001647207C|nr:rhamnan synthesis F family protein [Cyanobium sp. NS01]QNI69779.1 hypothetical protein CyaNS01_00631 [Cyanobium sp. NS01]